MRSLPAVLTQKFPAPAFGVTAKIELQALRDGDQVGLGTMGMASHWFGLRRINGKPRVLLVRCAQDGKCQEEPGAELPGFAVHLRMHVTAGARVAFWYSTDGLRYTQIGTPFDAGMGRWVGAQIGLFATGAPGSFADVDYLRITP